MAQPICPRCGNQRFGVARPQLVGRSLVNCDLVHCAECGAVVGVIDIALREKLDGMADALETIAAGR